MNKLKKILSALLLISSSYSFAHNVVGTVYAIANTIEGEVGYSNGIMAHAGQPVRVLDSMGKLLGETRIEEDGIFTFTPTVNTDHHFNVDMGSGHTINLVLKAEDLPDDVKAGKTTSSNKKAKNSHATPVASSNSASSNSANTAIDTVALSIAIEKALAKQVKPLKKEIKAMKDKAGMQDIIGGIGYIFGLCGVAIWLRNRQSVKK